MRDIRGTDAITVPAKAGESEVDVKIWSWPIVKQ
jgi:hypothetical protein